MDLNDQNKLMIELLQRLTGLETKMDMIISVKETAFEALQSTRSAHKRIDDVEGNLEARIEKLENETNQRFDKVDKRAEWFDRLIIGAVITGAIGLLFFFAQN